jgi:LDH2 family malate/lactate/ureidoglycolate dehydrogenase
MQDIRVDRGELLSFAARALRSGGAHGPQVDRVAEVLVWCDAAGRVTQGVCRLPVFIKRLEQGVLRCPCEPSFARAAPSLGLLDGDGGFGQFTARVAMDHAIELAAETGLGAVGVRHSNYFGAGAYYVHQAAERGMVGLAVSNSFSKVAPHGADAPVLGTNPMAFGAPRAGGRHLLLDMSTSAAAGSTVRIALERGEAVPGVSSSGVLLPLGGHKGFGLGLLVEVLGAVLSGAAIARQVRSMFKDFTGNGDNGHLLLALDVTKLMPLAEFEQRMELLAGYVRGADPDAEVRLPGEARHDELGHSAAAGARVEGDVAEKLAAVARERGLELPW